MVFQFPLEVIPVLSTGVGKEPNEIEALFQRSNFKPNEIISDASILLIKCANEMLPDTWPWAKTSGEGQAQSLTTNQLVTKWRNANDNVRLEIARMLSEVFHPKANSNGEQSSSKSVRDSCDTRVELVLPLLYGKWIHEKGNENLPNCLGKFQLLLALGKHLRIPMLSVSTIQAHYEVTNHYRYLMAKAIRCFFNKHEIELSEKRKEGIEKVIGHVEDARKYSNIQHFSVAYQASDHKWILVDPNMGLASYTPSDWDLDACYNELQKTHGTLPLKSITRISDSHPARCRATYQEFQECLSRFEQEVDEKKQRLGPQEVEDYFYKPLSEFSKQLTEDKECSCLLAELQHPAVEISLAFPRMASATLSHIGYEISHQIGDQVELAFSGLGNSQGHLYNLASSRYRPNSPIPSDVANDAARVLQKTLRLSEMNKRLIVSLLNSTPQ